MLLRRLKNEYEMGVTCSKYGEVSNAYKALVGKCSRTNSIGSPAGNWEENIKIFN
jgi:hypothetical protein